MLIVDVGGGVVDTLLDNEEISPLVNAWRTNFLHPRARPSLTHHLGWPSVTMIDDQGCVWATGSPTTVEEFKALIAEGERARDASEESPLPAYKYEIPTPPEGGGTWIQDAPQDAAVFVQPDRGAPAVIWEEKPWVYGNRADAALFEDRPAARTFLEQLPAKHTYLNTEGPYLACPLPIPAPATPPPTEGDEAEAADPGNGG